MSSRSGSPSDEGMEAAIAALDELGELDDASEAPNSEEDAARELETLPTPRRPVRWLTLAVMLVTVVVSGWLAWQLRGEAVYALESDEPVPLGAMAEASLDGVASNTFARANVELAGQPSLRFRRPIDGDKYQIALAQGPAAQRRWVAYRVPAELDGPRFVPPSLVAGRLVRIADLGARYRGLGKALSELQGAAPEAGWLLIDGHDPRGAGWLLALEIGLLALLAWNLFSLATILRRVPATAES